MENLNSFNFGDTKGEPSGKCEKIRHSKTVTIERKVSESFIRNFEIDNKFVILGKSEDWVLIWENFSDVFYQKSKNNNFQHLNLNAVKLSELGIGKFVVKKQKFTESDYTEFELTATRRPVGSSMKVMGKRRPGLQLKKLIETRSVSVIEDCLEVENEITMEILGVQESVFVQMKLVIYA